MQSADFDKLTDSRPINKLAMLVTQSKGVDNVQELYDRFRDLDEYNTPRKLDQKIIANKIE
jgi:hypothetical protein